MLATKLPLIVHSSILLSLIALMFGVAIGFVFLLISISKQCILLCFICDVFPGYSELPVIFLSCA